MNGRALAPDELASLVGHPAAEVAPLIQELEEHNVFSRDRKGRIYSRRMVRDEKVRYINIENGRKGGNPALTQHIDKAQPKSSPVNPKPTPPDKAPIPLPLPLPLEEETPNGVSPPIDPPPRQEGRHVRGRKPRPVIADWQPNSSHRERAFAAGHDAAWLADQADSYRNWNRNAKHPHTDYDAGFANWIKSPDRFAKPTANGHAAKQTARNNLFEGGARAAEAYYERERARNEATGPLLGGDGSSSDETSSD